MNIMNKLNENKSGSITKNKLESKKTGGIGGGTSFEGINSIIDSPYPKYAQYYDISNTITTAQATDPNDPDNINYNTERIFELIGRNADHLTVINDAPLGGATLFILVSHVGGFQLSRETPIYPQESKIYYNVYELRLRCALAGSPYRVSEYPILTP